MQGDPENPQNPFDSIGYYHNIALDYFIEHKSLFETSDTALFVNYTKNVLTPFFLNDYNYLNFEITQEESDSIIEFYLTEARFTEPDTIIKYYSISTTVESNLQNLFNYCKNYNDTTSFQPLITTIKNWESEIINGNLTTSEQEQLLKTSAILRWSLSYWWAVCSDTNNSWYTVIFSRFSKGNQNLQGNGSKIMMPEGGKWWVGVAYMGVSDALGYMIGGPVGAATGSAAAGIYYFWDEIWGAIKSLWDWLF